MSEIITLAKANEEIQMYLTNFKNASSAISKISDPESKNYYNGSEISFVFERPVIEALWNLNPTANGLRVYYGSHNNGTPTLVLIACEIIKDKDNNAAGYKNLIFSPQIAGGEWPDGVGKGSKNLSRDDSAFDVKDDDF